MPVSCDKQPARALLVISHVACTALRCSECVSSDRHHICNVQPVPAPLMYRAHSQHQRSDQHIAPAVFVQVAYAWAVTLGTEQGVQMLRRTGLLDAAVEYAAESGAFQQAFALASAAGLKSALPDIHLRYAMALEDEGRFGEAEQEFVAAGGLLLLLLSQQAQVLNRLRVVSV